MLTSEGRGGATHEAISGAMAGFLGRCVVAPFDVLKIRYQVQSGVERSKYPGLLASMAKIVREERLLGLWKGNAAGLSLYAVYGAVQFYTFARLSTAWWWSSLPINVAAKPFV